MLPIRYFQICVLMFLECLHKLNHLYQLLLLLFWLGYLQPEAVTLFKKRLRLFWHDCFAVNFAKFLRTPFFKERLWRALLNINTTGRLRDSNSCFKDVFASNSFKSLVSWSSIKRSIMLSIGSRFWNFKLHFMSLHWLFSIFVWRSSFKSSLVSLLTGFSKGCKIFLQESSALDLFWSYNKLTILLFRDFADFENVI